MPYFRPDPERYGGYDREKELEHAELPADREEEGKVPYPDNLEEKGWPDDDEELEIDEEHSGTEKWKVPLPDDVNEE